MERLQTSHELRSAGDCLRRARLGVRAMQEGEGLAGAFLLVFFYFLSLVSFFGVGRGGAWGEGWWRTVANFLSSLSFFAFDSS